jgi:hypothetical protein
VSVPGAPLGSCEGRGPALSCSPASLRSLDTSSVLPPTSSPRRARRAAPSSQQRAPKLHPAPTNIFDPSSSPLRFSIELPSTSHAAARPSLSPAACRRFPCGPPPQKGTSPSPSALGGVSRWSWGRGGRRQGSPEPRGELPCLWLHDRRAPLGVLI